MVFSGKVYDQVKEQLDRFLFGFDKDQLNVSILKGAVELENCNIKPYMVDWWLKSM